MYWSMTSMDVLTVIQCDEAIRAFEPWRGFLSEERIAKFERSTISKDGKEWCILSGPDLTRDRAGFGDSIEEAVRDFVSPYIRRQA